MTVMNKTIESLVFETVKERQPRPTELIEALRTEAYPAEVEIALSELLDAGSVVFGSDGHLREGTSVAAS